MARGTMTSKGQITVPKQVRDELGLQPGTEVEFTRTRDGSFRMDVVNHRHRLGDLANSIRYEDRPISLAEMERAIEDGAAGNER